MDEYALPNLIAALGAPTRWNNPLNAVGFAAALVRVCAITPAVEIWQRLTHHGGGSWMEHILRDVHEATHAVEDLVLRLPPVDRSDPTWRHQGIQLCNAPTDAIYRLPTAVNRTAAAERALLSATPLLQTARAWARAWVDEEANFLYHLPHWTSELLEIAVGAWDPSLLELQRALDPWRARDANPTDDRVRAFEAVLQLQLYAQAYDIFSETW